jgi:hypothetical protein
VTNDHLAGWLIAAEASGQQPGALAVLVALLTARLGGAEVSQADLIGEADAGAVLSLMTAMSLGLMSVLDDDGAGLLADIGAAAALRQRSPGDQRNP